MEIDLEKFANQSFDPREKDVEVPDLKKYMKGPAEKGEDGKEKPPVWRVRMLTAGDIARANEAQARNRDKNAIIQHLMSGDSKKIGEGVSALIGNGDEVPDDTARRIEMLVLGSVSPECNHDYAVLLSNRFPVVFTQLTNEILRLTGLGAEPGKPKRSSGSKTSETASSSAT